jgi:hypothetical protein
MNNGLTAALFAALLAATACAGNSKQARRVNPAPCPNIVVLNDAARVIEFDGEEVVEDVAYTGEITNVSVGCRYLEDEPIDMSISLEMAFGRGPKGDETEKIFSYFVAVTRKDLEIITKNEFPVLVKFNDNRMVSVQEDKVDKILIPRANDSISGENFEIVVGFKLTAEQAGFNRSGKSLKFPHL